MNSLRNDIIIVITSKLSYIDALDLSCGNKTYRHIITTCPKHVKRKIALQKKIVDGCFYHIRNKSNLSLYFDDEIDRSQIVTNYTHVTGDLLQYIPLWIYDTLESAQKRIEEYNKELSSITHLNRIYKHKT